MTISLPPKGNDAKVLGAYFSPLKVEALATPDMYVTVAEGAFWTADNKHQEFIGGTSPQLSAPGSDAKWVLLTVTQNGALNLIDGVAGATPVLPAPSLYKDELPLAAIFVGDTVTAITNDMIYDIRPLWQIPPDSVSQAQLNDLATFTYVNNGLAAKAETFGTTDANFTLNIGGGSINDSGIYINRLAGADVAIRFNEQATTGSPAIPSPQWEFTNDGSTWNAIGVSTGNYYLKTELDSGALDFLYYQQNQLTGVSGSGVLDTRYYEQSIADTLFAAMVHTHNVSDITGLNPQVETINLIAPVAGDVSLNINDILDVQNLGPAEAQVLRYNAITLQYENSQLTTDDLSDIDTSTIPPVAKDVLIHSGGVFVNRPLLKSDISDLLGTEFMLLTNIAGDPPVGDGPPDSNGVQQDIYGVKTFKDGLVVETSLTVTGTNTSIQTTDLKVTDPHIDINFGEVGPGVGGGFGTSGIRINRGGIGSPTSIADAILQWDENAGQWEIGVEGNLGKVLTGAHTHTSGDILDFEPRVTLELGNNELNTIKDVTYLTAPVAGDHLLYNFGAGNWENSSFATDVIFELNVNNLEVMQDVSYVATIAGEVLQWNGVAWINHLLIKSDVSDFIETEYIHTTGDETKTGNLTIVGDFIVQGGATTETRIQSENIYISDTFIVMNADEAGVGVGNGSGTSGIEIERGTLANSRIIWNENTNTWDSYDGSLQIPFELEGHTHLISDITDVTATAAELNYSTGVTSDIQPQLNDKISRTGDTMDAAASLTFAFGGEILGLPAVPSSPGSAAPKVYVDTEISTHAADNTLHISSAQNIFLDGLTLTGSPALTSGDVNSLIGISGNVQSALNTKADKIIPATQGNFAALDLSGNLTDSQIIINDTVSNTNTIWTSAEIDIRKPNKVIPSLSGNLAGLSTPNGDLIDSGLILNDSGVLVSELWSANKIDSTKADKVTPSVTNNLASLDVVGNLQDSGILINDAAGPNATTLWTSGKIDIDKADKVIPILANSIATLDGTGNLVSSEIAINDSINTPDALWTADKIDTTKVDKVLTAIAGNFAEFDAVGNITDNGTNALTFAASVHTHVSADVTDFSAAVDTRIGLATLDNLLDVLVAGAAANDVLQFVGGNWTNQSTFNAFGNDFVRSSGSVAESITGVKTFNDDTTFNSNVTITNDLIVLGTTTTLDSVNLEIQDKNILLNKGYSGPTSGSTGGGISLNRNEIAGSPITYNLATLIWDDTLVKWKAGVEGSEKVLATEGVTRAQPFYQLLTGSGSPLNAVFSLAWGVPTPAINTTGIQVFVNGVKQVEGALKSYTVDYTNPNQTVITFNPGAEPSLGADIEFYGFGYIA